MKKNYLILLCAAAVLIGCKDKASNKPNPNLAFDGDPSPAIMRTVDDTNRIIGSNISRVPNPPV